MDPSFIPCNSTAVTACRYLPDTGVLQLVFRDSGGGVDDYPCDPRVYGRLPTAAPASATAPPLS